MMNEQKTKWSENVILVDTAFADGLVFDFIVNFERMLDRPLGRADLCYWLDCLLLDAGIRPGDHETFVAFIHPKENRQLQQFTPALFEEELTGKAFRDTLGEFTLCSFPVETVTNRGEFMFEALKAAMEAKETQHILVVGDMEAYGSGLCKIAGHAVEGKVITLFAMHQLQPGAYRQQILGYSVMSALGIRADELK